ncbi:DUF2332 domain-containing protein [Pseudooceanicola algae]|uniref:DUF2332 domain-containing protein n=1 Tax=Pseudooceanicola algae TaxID=1537215 RepID=A0A418SJL5_9RHOB|nr:DUF2332 family protein [Pseudooceanicola algae]QPM91942.1 hypothetical protein PSAL_032040 [Pseudooceanicola algae]
MTPAADLQAHFLDQARACASLGSPFMERLLSLLARRMAPGNAVTDRLFAWEPRNLRSDAVALRLAGGLHALVLTGADARLAALYPPSRADEDTLWEAVQAALSSQADTLLHWLDNAPQTNEPRRATALIVAAGQIARHFPGIDLRLSELGASAGLNLQFDSFGLIAGAKRVGPEHPVLTLRPDWSGPLPAGGAYRIAGRGGADVNPLDRANRADMLRLRSYIWPDQPDRMERLDAILSLPAPSVDREDAGSWLARRLANRPAGQVDLVYHTIAWQYFPTATAAACQAALASAALRATDDMPLAWLSFEMDDKSPGAPVRLRLWPGAYDIPLGRMDFHGRWFQAC